MVKLGRGVTVSMGRSRWSAKSGFEAAAWLLLFVTRSPAARSASPAALLLAPVALRRAPVVPPAALRRAPSSHVSLLVGLVPRECTVSTPKFAFYCYTIYHCTTSIYS